MAGVKPYNLRLYRTVREKHHWQERLSADDAKAGFQGWHQRGYLPHYDAPGLVQFVTFRLVDSFPTAKRHEWELLLEKTDDARRDEARKRRVRLEEYLDRGEGECWLRNPRIAALTCDALRRFDGSRYELLSWVIMPNHVHTLVKIGEVPLSGVIESWKRFTAREANRILQRSGPFWQREYWDTFMRNDEQREKAIRYIERNPVKAGLCKASDQWEWSSAFRGARQGENSQPGKR